MELTGGLKYDSGKLDLTLIPWPLVGGKHIHLIVPLYRWYRGTIDADGATDDMAEAFAGRGRNLIVDAAASLNYGAAKYAPWNWENGIAASRLYAAACRHFYAVMRGERLDEESGLDHHEHLAFYAFAIHAANPDDRPI